MIRNWRNVLPTIAHKSGIDWRLLSNSVKTNGDIDAEVDSRYQCRDHNIRFTCEVTA